MEKDEELPEALRPDRSRMDKRLTEKPIAKLSRREKALIRWDERHKMGDWPAVSARVMSDKGLPEDIAKMEKLEVDTKNAMEKALEEKILSTQAGNSITEQKGKYMTNYMANYRQKKKAEGDFSERERDRLRKRQVQLQKDAEEGVNRRKYEKTTHLTDEEKQARNREKNRIKQQKYRESKKK
jgi:hypothetical protein